jgi:succinate dehydrogenase / fumarate reductase, membrane anchor subunit
MASSAYMAGSAKPVGGSRSEVMLWYYMRVSGLLLVFLALFHLWLNHIHTEVGELSFRLVVWRLNTYPVLRIADFLLLFFGLSHGVNGLKNVIDDYAKDPRWRFAWLTGLWVLFAIFLAAGTAVLFVLPGPGGM